MSRSIACIDIRDGKVFLAKRQNTGDMGGRWEFPGGKIDAGEDFVTAIKREMNEEFGVEVEVFEKLCEVSFEHKGKECFVDAFRVHFAEDGLSRRFTLTEHTDYKWEDFNKIPELNFVDSDLKIYAKLKEMGL
ncbi:ADP-ribose pyrophosphatase [Treponema sp. JC4]|uniref:(deoxy)nucleoside triphosphate pyrophosphohydrolase n=1 Tax=Treponema sp. JC4 TaxID=1124982 RepID=UPI00025B0A64|nr:NUDIX domain-containing protein [Treponema sp. JC4]EID85458.1 ADP-ribose pyrophosphatase [Treponema sp. JC4]